MPDQGLSPRLQARIRHAFPNDSSRVMTLLEEVVSGNQDRERVLAAVVLGADGDLRRVHDLIKLSRLDWRDVLVAGGLANEDWPERMNTALGWQELDNS